MGGQPHPERTTGEPGETGQNPGSGSGDRTRDRVGNRGDNRDEGRDHDRRPYPATRRSFLALCASAGVAVVAGCNGRSDEEPTTARPTPTATPPPTATATQTATRKPPTTTNARTETQQPANGTNFDFTTLYRRVIDSVTLVDTTSASGSGWVFDDAGRIVTNQHVVGTESPVNVRYDRDVWRPAEVVGTDAIGDLAVIEPSNPPDYATPLSLARAPPAIGDDIALIGAPFGLPGSLSVGVVSATGRLLDSPTGWSIPDAIQIDATANPGNSGGPILSTGGDVVGILSAGEGVSVNFGIPARLVDRVVPSLIEDGGYRYSTLGVSLLEVDPTIARANELEDVTGVLVTDVSPGGPAAGELQGSYRTRIVDGYRVPVGGDVIVGIDGQTVTSEAALVSSLTFSTRPGDRVTLTVIREGTRGTVELEVGSRSRP